MSKTVLVTGASGLLGELVIHHLGSKYRLSGLSRQRVHQLLQEGSACPDAERTLLLLIWLQARLSGRDLS